MANRHPVLYPALGTLLGGLALTAVLSIFESIRRFVFQVILGIWQWLVGPIRIPALVLILVGLLLAGLLLQLYRRGYRRGVLERMPERKAIGEFEPNDLERRILKCLKMVDGDSQKLDDLKQRTGKTKLELTQGLESLANSGLVEWSDLPLVGRLFVLTSTGRDYVLSTDLDKKPA